MNEEEYVVEVRLLKVNDNRKITKVLMKMGLMLSSEYDAKHSFTRVARTLVPDYEYSD